MAVVHRALLSSTILAPAATATRSSAALTYAFDLKIAAAVVMIPETDKSDLPAARKQVKEMLAAQHCEPGTTGT
jgi:hypothetical protein